MKSRMLDSETLKVALKYSLPKRSTKAQKKPLLKGLMGVAVLDIVDKGTSAD